MWIWNKNWQVAVIAATCNPETAYVQCAMCCNVIGWFFCSTLQIFADTYLLPSQNDIIYTFWLKQRERESEMMSKKNGWIWSNEQISAWSTACIHCTATIFRYACRHRSFIFQVELIVFFRAHLQLEWVKGKHMKHHIAIIIDCVCVRSFFHCWHWNWNYFTCKTIAT